MQEEQPHFPDGVGEVTGGGTGGGTGGDGLVGVVGVVGLVGLVVLVGPVGPPLFGMILISAQFQNYLF